MPEVFPYTPYTSQIYAEDCTGCNLFAEVCPVIVNTDNDRKAINFGKKTNHTEIRDNISFFEQIPINECSSVDFSSVRRGQFLESLFEFSGAKFLL
ncbi:pyruvate-ferredoxin/flavodoxin oxidoreductase [Mucilaginibacter sp. OK283]|jgi:pyruvate-ferredoxin/flavodoxin oxidoreductase|nr:pyruvate-ferredoxin/flavodoxin oxidoreductase [Mucilaginibacter sp. OK283]